MSFTNILNRPALGRGGVAPALSFFAGGLNIFFNQDDYDAYLPAAKALAVAGAGPIGSGVGYSAAANTTLFNAAGQLIVRTGPRITYEAGKMAGYWVEPQTTNFTPNNTIIGGTGWTNVGTTVGAGAGGANPIYPSNNLNRLTFAAGADSRTYAPSRVTTGLGGTQVTHSVWARAIGGTGTQRFRFGYYGESTTNTVFGADIVVSSPTLQRYSTTFTLAPGETTGIYPFIANQAAGGVSTANLDVWGFQDEAGGFMSSTIITGAAGVNRTANFAQQNTGTVPGGFTHANGTWVVVFNTLGPTTPQVLINVGGGTNDYARTASATQAGYVDSGGSTLVGGLALPSPVVPITMAVAYIAGGAVQVSVNGGAVVTGASAGALVGALLNYGAGLAGATYALIRRIAYSQTVATPAQLIQLSAGTL